MNDIYQQVLSYLGSIWRRRWYAVAVAWLVCGAGWTFVAGLPDRYESSARVYVDMDTMLRPLMRGITVEMNVMDQIDIMKRTLLSRPNLEKILLMTDLDLKVRNDADKEAIIGSLSRRIKIEQQGRNLFKIGYEDLERGMARRVVQSVMQVFVESNLGASRQDMETTQRFLESQLRDYERQLIEAEARLAKFKQDNIGLLPGTGNYHSQMQGVTKALADAEARIEEATMVRDEYRAQLAEIPQYIEVARNDGFPDIGAAGGWRGPESDLQLRLVDLQVALESLLSRYTEKHPDVVAINRRIAATQKQIAEGAAALDGLGPTDGVPAEGNGSRRNLVPNPMYEQIKLQLVNQEGAIAALKSRATEARKQVERWAAMAQRAPEIEAELTRLNRDYSIIRDGYDGLRKRQESARLARDMDTKAQKIQFRVVDPPTLPLQPSGPNRPILTTAVLFVGIGVGIAFAFLLSQINTTFISVNRLRSTFTLPVLGRISAIISSRQRRQRLRELSGFAVVTLGLFAAFTGLLAIETFGTESAVRVIRDLGIL